MFTKLTFEQQQSIFGFADRVPPVWRSRFIDAVVDELFGYYGDAITDAQVAEAVHHIAGRFCVNAEQA